MPIRAASRIKRSSSKVITRSSLPSIFSFGRLRELHLFLAFGTCFSMSFTRFMLQPAIFRILSCGTFARPSWRIRRFRSSSVVSSSEVTAFCFAKSIPPSD
jgi:hypothetical protein